MDALDFFMIFSFTTESKLNIFNLDELDESTINLILQ